MASTSVSTVSRSTATSGVAKRASRAREASAPTALRSPRAEPARSARATKAAAAAAVTKAAPKKAGADVGEQRIYHVTHINNLAGVLSSGAILADASKAWESRPIVDISSAETRESRRAVLVAGQGSLSVAKYVPFFLSPDASVWDSIRALRDDPRLALEAHGSAPFDFVILVSTVKKALSAQTADAVSADAVSADAESTDAEATDAAPDAASVVATDGDATGALTRFGATRDDAERLLRKLRADAESPAILEAEFLVQESFPFELVTLIGVANDKVRDVVKPILAASAHRPKVAVYPPWFQPAEESAG
ncbi:MAG: DarT ssDNA thymidine ADP-ribosyltransferase family protein [Cryobacterium sp.]